MEPLWKCYLYINVRRVCYKNKCGHLYKHSICGTTGNSTMTVRVSVASWWSDGLPSGPSVFTWTFTWSSGRFVDLRLNTNKNRSTGKSLQFLERSHPPNQLAGGSLFLFFCFRRLNVHLDLFVGLIVLILISETF